MKCIDFINIISAEFAFVVWGLAATSLMLLKNEGMPAPYSPAGIENLNAKFVDSDRPAYRTGMDAWVAARDNP